MYLLAKFGDQFGGDTNSYIKSYMDTLEKSELTTSICHIAKFLKIRNTDLQFQSPGYGCEKKNTGDCKAFCVSRKRNTLRK